MTATKQRVPPFALEYGAQVPSGRKVVGWFHSWLARGGRALLQLEQKDIEEFLRWVLSAQTARAATPLRKRLLRYFDWLHERQLLRFDPRLLSQRVPALSPEVITFLRTLEPTHKPSTVAAYRTSLRHFGAWLDSGSLTSAQLERHHVEAWLQALHARETSACHRVHTIACVRTFVRWLEEQPGYVGVGADYLFRRSDFPKLPQYLPRPISDDLDRVLQRRLQKSKDPSFLGLLLMRRTGIRVGELRSLPLHCVHLDHRARQFLKVPLGKLNTERLVPIDPKTARLIEKLRIRGSSGKRGKRRTHLLQAQNGGPLPYPVLRLAMQKACSGLVAAEPLTTHRLRHTYATSMLAAGVSLPVLMKLLGHVDYRMTLRYADITVETVAREYVDAYASIEQRYGLRSHTAAESDPAASLDDLARHILKRVADAGLDQQSARDVVRRLRRLNTVVRKLLLECSRHATRSD